MNIKAEEFIEKNLEAILPHLLEANADNQVGNQLSGLFLNIRVVNDGYFRCRTKRTWEKCSQALWLMCSRFYLDV